VAQQNFYNVKLIKEGNRMDYSNLIEFSLLGMAGSISMEIMKIYQLRSKLTLKKYQNMFKNPLFWIVTIGMTIASGFFAWAINANSLNPSILQIVISGIGANSIIRNISANAVIKKDGIELGGSEKFDIKDIF